MPRDMLVTAYATHVNPPDPAFPHTVVKRRDRTDPELRSHLSRMLGFILQRGCEGPPAVPDIRTHLSHVQTQLDFEIGDEADREALREWAERSNALFFLPDSTLRDPSFRVLFHPEPAMEDLEAAVPRFSHGQDRKLGTMAALHAWGVHTIDHLPALPADPEIRLPPIGTVIDRMAALLAVAVRSESMQNGDLMTIERIEQVLPRATAALTESERRQLSSPDLDDQRQINMLWRYECVPVFLWTLGLQPELAAPVSICDVPGITEMVLTTNLDELEQAGWIRPVGEILDQADLMYRLHWALRDAQLNDMAAPSGVDPSIVIERRWALEWLLDSTVAWDEICLST